jgi:hypothetical protein
MKSTLPERSVERGDGDRVLAVQFFDEQFDVLVA